MQPVGLSSCTVASACNPSARSMLSRLLVGPHLVGDTRVQDLVAVVADAGVDRSLGKDLGATPHDVLVLDAGLVGAAEAVPAEADAMVRSEEQTSELQSLVSTQHASLRLYNKTNQLHKLSSQL